MTKSTVLSCEDCIIGSRIEAASLKKTCLSSCPAAQRVSKKYALRRKLQRKEYKNLKKVLPSLSRSPKASKRDIIEEAIKYIDYLHGEIANRFYSSDGVFKASKKDSPVANCVKKLLLFPEPVHCKPTLNNSQQFHRSQISQGQLNRMCQEEFLKQEQFLQQNSRKFSNMDTRLRI